MAVVVRVEVVVGTMEVVDDVLMEVVVVPMRVVVEEIVEVRRVVDDEVWIVVDLVVAGPAVVTGACRHWEYPLGFNQYVYIFSMDGGLSTLTVILLAWLG